MKHSKKSFLTAMSLLLATSFTIHAQDYISTYTSVGDEMKVEATLPSSEEDNLFCYIQIQGEYNHDNVTLFLVGEDELNTFRHSLTQLKGKFSEWRDIAKRNNVKSYNKEFDIPFPSIKIGWYGSKWFIDRSETVNFRFIVLDDGTSAVTASGEATHWENEYITQKWYIMFKSPEEIDSLLRATDPETIRKHDRSETDELFS